MRSPREYQRMCNAAKCFVQTIFISLVLGLGALRNEQEYQTYFGEFLFLLFLDWGFGGCSLVLSGSWLWFDARGSINFRRPRVASSTSVVERLISQSHDDDDHNDDGFRRIVPCDGHRRGNAIDIRSFINRSRARRSIARPRDRPIVIRCIDDVDILIALLIEDDVDDDKGGRHR